MSQQPQNLLYYGVQREVNTLAAAGLLVGEPRGRQVFYGLDPRCRVLPELKGNGNRAGGSSRTHRAGTSSPTCTR